MRSGSVAAGRRGRARGITGRHPGDAPTTWPYSLPAGSCFAELNVRTYTTIPGRPGIWFLSLDAASRLAVEAARRGDRLPYFPARMRASVDADRVELDLSGPADLLQLAARQHVVFWRHAPVHG